MSSQENADKNSTGIVWTSGLFIAVIGGIWYKFKLQLIAGYVFLKKIELTFLQILSSILFLPISSQVSLMIDYLEIYDYYNPSMVDIHYIGQKTGFYMNFFFAAIAVTMTYKIWNRNAVTRFNKKHSMASLAAQEQHNWAQISPVVGQDLVSMDINKGPWAMGDTPLQFCKKHDLLEIETVADRKNPWKLEGVKKATLKKKPAMEVLKKQLGPLWEGEPQLPAHRKALFAVFLARIENDKKGADNLLVDLSVSHTKGKLDYSGVQPLLNKHSKSKAVQMCIQNHAYVMTLFAAMISLARSSGVLATSSFLWLKLIDRELWYMLNSTGRQTPYTEVAAPWAHYLAEKEMGRALFKPVLEESMNALEEALDKVVYTEDE